MSRSLVYKHYQNSSYTRTFQQLIQPQQETPKSKLSRPIKFSSDQLTDRSDLSSEEIESAEYTLDEESEHLLTLEDRLNLDKIFEAFDLINQNTQSSKILEIYDCQECKTQDSIKIIDNGTYVCINCGEIKGNEIFEEFECQYSGMGFGDRTGTARSGLSSNNLLFKSNFSTKIVGNKTSYSLKQINNVWDSLDYKERTLLKIFKKIADNCRRHLIPNNVISYSQVLYKQVYEKQRNAKKGSKGSRSDKLEGLIAACIYYSCKSYQISRNHDEIATICDVPASEVSYGCKIFHKLMYKELDMSKYQTTYKHFIERFSSHLNLEEDEVNLLSEVCEEINSSGLLNNCKPATKVAVAIYFCSIIYGFNLEKKDISQKCDTTEATLNNHYRHLLNHLDRVIV